MGLGVTVPQAVNDYVCSPDYIDTPMVCVRDGDMDGTVTNHYNGRGFSGA